MGHVALVARLGTGDCAHDGLGGGHGCHLLTQLAQLVAQGRHVISNSDGLGAHGLALGVSRVAALYAVILNEKGENFKAHLAKVVASLALVDLACFIHANDVGQTVRGQVVCKPFEFGVELEEILHHSTRCSLGAGRHALLNQGLALIGSLGDARVVVLDLVQVLNVQLSPICVVVVVAAQPVLEGGVACTGVLVAGLDKLLHACLLVRSGHLLIVELSGMLTSYSRMELVIEEDGLQLSALVEVQHVLKVVLELEELGPALVCELLGDSIFGVVGHDDVDVSVDAARCSCCGQSNGRQMPIALVVVQVKVVGCSGSSCRQMVRPYGRYPNGQETQSLLAHTGSATGSDNSLDAPVMYKVSSNVHDYVGQIKGPGVRNQVVPRLSRGCIRCTQKCHSGCVARLYATNTARPSVAVLQERLCSRYRERHTKNLSPIIKEGLAPALPLCAACRNT
eukprot:6210848-Pleurochrysis_carterae.AAC.1